MATWRTTDSSTHTLNVLRGTYKPFTTPIRSIELPILPSTTLTAAASVLQHLGRGRKYTSFEVYSTGIAHYNTLRDHAALAHAGTFRDSAGSTQGCAITSLSEPQWVKVNYIRWGLTLTESSTA